MRFTQVADNGGLAASTHFVGEGITGINPNTSATAEGTIGFYAKLGDTYGVVTAGHVVQVSNGFISEFNTLFYTATAIKFSNSGPIDATFCQIKTSANNVTGSILTIYNYNVTIYLYDNPVEGSQVSVYGAKTNQRVSTTILSTSSTHPIDGVYYYNLIELDDKPVPGDSGGPILFGSTLIGIVHGFHGGNGLACKAKYIIDTWGLTGS